jgi:hypothetical protein
MVTRRVQTRLERKRTGPEEWLVVTRRPLVDAETLEAQASRGLRRTRAIATSITSHRLRDTRRSRRSRRWRSWRA